METIHFFIVLCYKDPFQSLWRTCLVSFLIKHQISFKMRRGYIQVNYQSEPLLLVVILDLE